MLKNEVVQTMSLNIKFSYLAENSKFSRSNSYFSILTPTFLRDGFLNSCFQNPSENSAGGSVMVCGGIAHGIKSQLIIVAGNNTAVRYRDEILRPVAVPLVQQRNLILQQDNARPHVARVCQDFLANNNIAPLAWPPYSPEFTPIEHMWDELDRRVRTRRNPPATLAQLRNALIDEWNNIPMRTVNALVNSVQRRIRTATAARGGHTRY